MRQDINHIQAEIVTAHLVRKIMFLADYDYVRLYWQGDTQQQHQPPIYVEEFGSRTTPYSAGSISDNPCIL